MRVVVVVVVVVTTGKQSQLPGLTTDKSLIIISFHLFIDPLLIQIMYIYK